MKKGFRKAIASMLAVTMVLGSSIMSFAGDTTTTETTASGNFEGHVDKSVVNITLPTVSADTYNFIIDPEALIRETNAERYGGASQADFVSTETSGVWFANSVDTDSGKVTYKNTSAMVEVSNQSSISVNVTMAIEITDLNDNIKIVSQNSEVNDGTDTNLWLAVTDGTENVSVNGTTASMTKLIAGNADAYKVSWNAAESEYQYVIDEAQTGISWSSAQLGLTGACNTSASANWSAAGLSEESTVKVTWSYEGVGVAVEGTAAVLQYNKLYYLALRGAGDAELSEEATAVTVNGVDVTDKASLIYGYVAVKASDLNAVGISTATGSVLEATYTVDGTQYKASYTCGQ